MRLFLTIPFLLLLYLDSYGQDTDTLFKLIPPIHGIKEVNNLDTFKGAKKILVFSHDSDKNINIQVFNKKGKLLCDGNYRKDSSYILNTISSDRSGIDTIQSRLIICNLYRHGYWTEFRRKREKRVYFHNGEKIKVKIKY